MAALSLPLRVDVPDFAYSIDLDEKSFVFAFRYNERSLTWYLSISDPDGSPVLLGVPLVTDYPLLRAYRDRVALPPGELEVIDLSGRGGRPGRHELGSRFQLLYHPATDVAALA